MPAITTRGFKENDFELVGKIIYQALSKEKDLKELKEEVLALTKNI